MIDLLTGECSRDGHAIAPLGIASALKSWFYEDLARHAISEDSVDEALLQVTFRTSETDRQRDQSTAFGDPTPPFIQCELSCQSKIVSGVDCYQSTYNDHLEWPKAMAR